MKKVLLCLLLIICLLIVLFIPKNNKKEEGLTTITLAEVTHSVFYAPLYVSIEKGYFKNDKIVVSLMKVFPSKLFC